MDVNVSSPYAWSKETGKVSFGRISEFLMTQMNSVKQTKNGISEHPVVIKLFFNSGVSISMIDMPGLTKIALKGQPQNFPELLENMSRTYIQNPNSIILAVSPANVDVANSDALKLARDYDS